MQSKTPPVLTHFTPDLKTGLSVISEVIGSQSTHARTHAHAVRDISGRPEKNLFQILQDSLEHLEDRVKDDQTGLDSTRLDWTRSDWTGSDRFLVALIPMASSRHPTIGISSLFFALLLILVSSVWPGVGQCCHNYGIDTIISPSVQSIVSNEPSFDHFMTVNLLQYVRFFLFVCFPEGD